MIALLAAMSSCAPVASAPGGPPDSVAATVVVAPKVLVAAAGGLELHVVTWTAGPANGVAWLASVPRDGSLGIAPSADVRPLRELVGEPSPPWAAINGGFYEEGPMGLVVSSGVESHALAANGGSGVVQFDSAGANIVHRDAWAPGATEALQSIDRLVDGGASLVHPRPDAHRDARSAVAISDDRLWLVAAFAANNVTSGPDGIQLIRTVGEGMTLAEFADFLVVALGAKQALNLDGAVSTQMIVAMPTWRWVVRGERGTINGVVITPPAAALSQ